jgi:hypothetical protein
MFTGVIPVYSENKTKAINMLFGWNAWLFNFEVDSIVYVLIHVPTEVTNILQKEPKINLQSASLLTDIPRDSFFNSSFIFPSYDSKIRSILYLISSGWQL